MKILSHFAKRPLTFWEYWGIVVVLASLAILGMFFKWADRAFSIGLMLFLIIFPDQPNWRKKPYEL